MPGPSCVPARSFLRPEAVSFENPDDFIACLLAKARRSRSWREQVWSAVPGKYSAADCPNGTPSEPCAPKDPVDHGQSWNYRSLG
jgi:hypothetical protein